MSIRGESELPTDSPQIHLIQEWNRGFKELSVELLAKPLHKDFRRVIYPRSLGQPAQNKDEWLEDIKGIIGFASGFEVTLHTVIDTPGKVVVHSTGEAKNPYGVNTSRESIFIVHIVTDDDGTLKIKQIDEFTDSKGYLELVQTMTALKANKQ